MQEHARPCIPHHLPDAFPHDRFETMSGTLGTRGLVCLILTPVQALHRVDLQLLTLSAQGVGGVMVAMTEQRNHHLDCMPFTLQTVLLHQILLSLSREVIPISKLQFGNGVGLTSVTKICERWLNCLDTYPLFSDHNKKHLKPGICF